MRNSLVDMVDAYFEASYDIQQDMPICAEARIMTCATELVVRGHSWDEVSDLADLALKQVIHTNLVLGNLT